MPEPSRQRRLLVLGICCMSLFIVGLDSTIVNVALPSIGRELHAPVSGLQWTIDAYALVLASLLMFSGSTADRIGRRKTFRAGLAVFTIVLSRPTMNRLKQQMPSTSRRRWRLSSGNYAHLAGTGPRSRILVPIQLFTGATR